ncbi:hypothetical protein FC63_GL001204 [Lactobacillus amylovorus DSM 20531]|nr:hypothetical protein FC63_GL001204 [Lactobacillus amylovorus DSM 20531]
MEPIFGHMKSVFGMLRTHLRGKKKVRNHVYDDESEKIWSQQEGKAFDFSFQKQKTR